MNADFQDHRRILKSLLNKCINIPCKRFRSPDFIGLKSVPDIVAGIHRWWLLAPLSPLFQRGVFLHHLGLICANLRNLRINKMEV
jgi:hypothetical protein